MCAGRLRWTITLDTRSNKQFQFVGLLLGFLAILLLSVTVVAKKKSHPYDVYNHEMHTALFESVSLSCEKICHADPKSYENRKKVNPMGCHVCHKDPNPPLEGPSTCTLCHEGGPPKPKSHRAGWDKKHQIYAKQNPNECQGCHTNQIFCIDCHKKRQTVLERVHRRNFRFFHSIEARANPRRCNACHNVVYCRRCHAGRGTSKR